MYHVIVWLVANGHELLKYESHYTQYGLCIIIIGRVWVLYFKYGSLCVFPLLAGNLPDLWTVFI